jgi:hypothetical protein
MIKRRAGQSLTSRERAQGTVRERESWGAIDDALSHRAFHPFPDTRANHLVVRRWTVSLSGKERKKETHEKNRNRSSQRLSSPSTAMMNNNDDPDSVDIETIDATLYSLPPSPTSIHHPTPLPHPQTTEAEGETGDPRLIHLPPSPVPPPSPEPTEGVGGGGDVDEGRLCRICFAGEEEEAELGKLFAPCRCSGSMRVKHPLCPLYPPPLPPSTSRYTHV